MVSIKEQLVDFMRLNGYDFFTACQEADRVIMQVKKEGKKKTTYYLNNGKSVIIKTLTTL